MTEQLDRLISKREVARTIGATTRTVDNWRKAGRIPEPQRLPNGRPAWRQSVLKKVLNLN